MRQVSYYGWGSYARDQLRHFSDGESIWKTLGLIRLCLGKYLRDKWSQVMVGEDILQANCLILMEKKTCEDHEPEVRCLDFL